MPVFQFNERFNTIDGNLSSVIFNPSITNYPSGNITANLFNGAGNQDTVVGVFENGGSIFSCDNPFGDGVSYVRFIDPNLTVPKFNGLLSNNLPVDLTPFGPNQVSCIDFNGILNVVYTDGTDTYYVFDDEFLSPLSAFSDPVLIPGLEPGITLRSLTRFNNNPVIAIAYNNDKLIFVSLGNMSFVHKENLFTDLDFSEGASIQSTNNIGSDALFVVARDPDTKQYYIELYSDDLYIKQDNLFDTVPNIYVPTTVGGGNPVIQFIYGTTFYNYYKYPGNPLQSVYSELYLPINPDTYRQNIISFFSFATYIQLSATTNTIYINILGYLYTIPDQKINETTQLIGSVNYGSNITFIYYMTDGVLYTVKIPGYVGSGNFTMNTGDQRGLSGLNARLKGINIPGTDFLVGLEYNTIYNIYDTDTPNSLYVSDPVIDDDIYSISYDSHNTSLVMTVDALNYTPSPYPMTNETLTDPVFLTGSEGFYWYTVDIEAGTYYFTPGKYLYTDIIDVLNSQTSSTAWNFKITNRKLTTDGPAYINDETYINFLGGLDKILGTGSSINGINCPYTAPSVLGNKEVWSIVDAQGNAILLEQTGQPFPSSYETLTVALTGNSLNQHWSGTYNVRFNPDAHEAIFDEKFNFDTKYGSAPYGTISFAYTDPISRNLSLPTRIIITAPLASMRAAGTTTVSFAVSDTVMDLIKFSNLERRMVRVEQVTMNYSTDTGLNNPIGVQILCPEFINTYNYDEIQDIDVPIIFSQQYSNPMFYTADTFNVMNGYVLPTTIRTNGLVHFSVKHVLVDGTIVDAPLNNNLTIFKFTLCAYVT
jgi:hypothetical protein